MHMKEHSNPTLTGHQMTNRSNFVAHSDLTNAAAARAEVKAAWNAIKPAPVRAARPKHRIEAAFVIGCALGSVLCGLFIIFA